MLGLLCSFPGHDAVIWIFCFPLCTSMVITQSILLLQSSTDGMMASHLLIIFPCLNVVSLIPPLAFQNPQHSGWWAISKQDLPISWPGWKIFCSTGTGKQWALMPQVLSTENVSAKHECYTFKLHILHCVIQLFSVLQPNKLHVTYIAVAINIIVLLPMSNMLLQYYDLQY